jgi:hypothetical protein
MKHIVFFVFTLISCSAWSQADRPAPPAPAKAPGAQEPMKEAAKPAAEPAKQAGAGPKIPNPRRWHEDARHCLERANNTDIIKCAEEFL